MNTLATFVAVYGYCQDGVHLPLTGGILTGPLNINTLGYPLIDLSINSSNYFRLVYDNPNDKLLFQKSGNTVLGIGGNGRLYGTYGSFAGNVGINSLNDSRIYMQNSTPGTGRNWNLVSDTDATYKIGIYGSGDYLTINSNGNTSLSGALTGTSATFDGRVYGTTTASSSDFNSGGLIAYGSGTTASYTQIGYDAEGNFGWITPLTTGIAYRNLILTPHGGNVGIGTTTPDIGNSGEKILTLQGSSVRSTIQLANTSTGINGIAGSLKAYNNATFLGSVDMFADGATNSGGFQFYTVNSGNNVAALRIASTGNVSIGTTDALGYKLAVAGNVIAESVKVALQDNWPDYVFKKQYILPSLQEVEKFVQLNNHLPDMPSEAEVKNQGINLGQMDGRLLKKIEELTLYMIDFKKEMDLLKQKNQELEEEVAKLKADKGK